MSLDVEEQREEGWEKGFVTLIKGLLALCRNFPAMR